MAYVLTITCDNTVKLLCSNIPNVVTSSNLFYDELNALMFLVYLNVT